MTSKFKENRRKYSNIPKANGRETLGGFIEENELKEDVIKIITSTVISILAVTALWYFFFR